jgi:hypothetical protein
MHTTLFPSLSIQWVPTFCCCAHNVVSSTFTIFKLTVIVASLNLFHHIALLNYWRENKFNLMVPMVSRHLLNLNENLLFSILYRDTVSIRNNILLPARPCLSTSLICIQFIVFWNVVPCMLEERYHVLGEPTASIVCPKMEMEGTFCVLIHIC